MNLVHVHCDFELKISKMQQEKNYYDTIIGWLLVKISFFIQNKII